MRAIAILVLMTACGGAQDTHETVPDPVAAAEVAEPVNPLALLPASSLGVVTVDFSRLRESAHYATLVRWVDLIPDMTPERAQAIRTVLERGEVAHLALVEERSRLNLGSIYVRGDFDMNAAQSLLRTIVDESVQHELQPRDVEGYPGFGDARAALVEIEPGSYVIGPYNHLQPALRSPVVPEAMSNPQVVEARAGLSGTTVVSGWVVGSEPVWAEVVSAIPIDPSMVRTVQGGAFELDLPGDLNVVAHARGESDASAQALSNRLNQQVDELTGSFAARALGLGVIGEGFSSSAEGPMTTARLSMTQVDVTSLMERFEGFLRLSAAAR
ncbi:MAG: hypothetical protein AAGE52_20865 [Myxococcota bacterium]